MKLLDWVNESKLDWEYLSENPSAISLLEKNPNRIEWHWFCRNSAAIFLIESNLDRINWWFLSGNPAAINLPVSYTHLTLPTNREV